MRFKSEFVRRLNRLDSALTKAFYLDCNDSAEKSGLFPALFSVFSYLWSSGFKIYK